MLIIVLDKSGKALGSGSGFPVSADGRFITNYHVIKKAASGVAKSEQGGHFEAEGVVAADLKNDLVLLTKPVI